jgi:hypothetical protein
MEARLSAEVERVGGVRGGAAVALTESARRVLAALESLCFHAAAALALFATSADAELAEDAVIAALKRLAAAPRAGGAASLAAALEPRLFLEISIAAPLAALGEVADAPRGAPALLDALGRAAADAWAAAASGADALAAPTAARDASFAPSIPLTATLPFFIAAAAATRRVDIAAALARSDAVTPPLPPAALEAPIPADLVVAATLAPAAPAAAFGDRTAALEASALVARWRDALATRHALQAAVRVRGAVQKAAAAAGAAAAAASPAAPSFRALLSAHLAPPATPAVTGGSPRNGDGGGADAHRSEARGASDGLRTAVTSALFGSPLPATPAPARTFASSSSRSPSPSSRNRTSYASGALATPPRRSAPLSPSRRPSAHPAGTAPGAAGGSH